MIFKNNGVVTPITLDKVGCPWCGSKKALRNKRKSKGNVMYRFVCPDCRIQVDIPADTDEEAMQRWNSRVKDKECDELLNLVTSAQNSLREFQKSVTYTLDSINKDIHNNG